MEPEQCKYPIVADRLNALDFDEDRPPRLPERVPELPHSLPPAIDGLGIGKQLRGPELEVRSDVVQLPLKIASVPRFVPLPHQLLGTSSPASPRRTAQIRGAVTPS
jgi:hypothetical protein